MQEKVASYQIGRWNLLRETEEVWPILHQMVPNFVVNKGKLKMIHKKTRLTLAHCYSKF